MSEVIYVALLNEGGECWRPVHADNVENDVYEITVEQPPGNEEWEFPPHAPVRCREHRFADNNIGLVAFERVR